VTVRSEELKDDRPIERPRARPRIGFLRPGHVERAFIALLYLTLLTLVTLSVIGTFYGWRGQNAPLSHPWSIIDDIQAAFSQFAIAAGIQGALTLTQYGARQLARHDRRWWTLYLVALGVSVYYNVQAYWAPLMLLIPWFVAAVLIVAGDVLPEFLAVRHD
jgi:hypothetical protein